MSDDASAALDSGQGFSRRRIPGSTGACYPSLTIAALAEHSISMICVDVGHVF